MNMITADTKQTMSSLEVAELVESRHDKVKLSIERLAKRGVIEFPPMGEIKTATKPTLVYLLDKRSSQSGKQKGQNIKQRELHV